MASFHPPAAHLYFVRHGRSVHNESDEDRPLIWDAPLHKIGIRQAARLRRRFAQVPLSLVIASPLTRALQTALIAMGEWAALAPGGAAVAADGSEVRVSAVSRPTVEHHASGSRFDASDDEIEPAEAGGALGPGAAVRLRKPVRLQDDQVLEASSLCTVTNARVAVDGAAQPVGCTEVLPQRARSQSFRCPVVALPEATEQLHESDDLGSPAPALRARFPGVDFGRLPFDQRAWWWADPDLPASLDGLACRACWTAEDYDEPDEAFEARIERLVAEVAASARRHQHVAIFAHCWVLEEIWRRCFGRKRRFDNAEVAVVEVSATGQWTQVE